ncbi:MAG: hypothetical protein E7240_00080 [Lachnospiraceae bacterium]|nr:hypothetical protein [Lachnospiraceae bacterium]
MRFNRNLKWLLSVSLAVVMLITPVAAHAAVPSDPSAQESSAEEETGKGTVSSDEASEPSGNDGSTVSDPEDSQPASGESKEDIPEGSAQDGQSGPAPSDESDESTAGDPADSSQTEESVPAEETPVEEPAPTETPVPTETPAAPVTPVPTETPTPTPTPAPEDALLTTMDSLVDAKLEDGIYTIYSALSSSRVLDIQSASQVNGGQVQIYADNDTMAQQFFIRSLGSGLYAVENLSSGLMLDVSGAKKVNGTKIQQYKSNNTNAQKWYILKSAKDGYCVIASALDKTMVLDVTGGKNANSVKVQLYKADNTDKQLWKFKMRNPAVKISDGAYTIASAADTGKVVDIKSASKANAANVQIYTSNGTNAQKFWFESVGDGWYEITSICSGRALDVKSASRTEGTNVQQYTPNKTNAQKWRIFEGANDTVLIYSGVGGRVLTVNGSTANATNVQIGLYTRSKYQRFILNKTSGSKTAVGSTPAASSTTASQVQSEGLYTIRSLVGGLTVLDVNAASFANAANVQIYQSNDTNAQKWYLVKHGDWYQIISAVSGKALDVKSAGTADGTNVQQYTKNNTNAQDWKLVPTGDSDGSVYIVSRLGKYLDVKAGNPSNKTNVQIYTGNKTKAQKFILSKTSLANGWASEANGTRIYLISGKKATGWNRIGSYNYYFYSDGSLAVSTTINGYKVDAEGRRTGVKISTRPKTLYHSKTILSLLKNAMVPCGRVLYIWGGGHEEPIADGYAGYPDFWDSFYISHATDDYNRHDYEWEKKAGLDCSGYVGWVVYNTLHSKSGEEWLAFSTSEIKSIYLKKGYADSNYIDFKAATTTTLPGKVYPGDLCIMAGHVMICLGECSDGSVVFLHSAPADGDGGGVQISGTKRPVKNSQGKVEWKSDSQAAALAQKYMSKYFPEWPYGTRAALGSEYMKFAYGRVHWKSNVLSDPEGVSKMSADQVLKLLLGSV